MQQDNQQAMAWFAGLVALGLGFGVMYWARA